MMIFADSEILNEGSIRITGFSSASGSKMALRGTGSFSQS